MAKTIKEETKKEDQRKAKRCTTHRKPKKKNKLVPFVVRTLLPKWGVIY
jgi:hypothetical protein